MDIRAVHAVGDQPYLQLPAGAQAKAAGRVLIFGENKQNAGNAYIPASLALMGRDRQGSDSPLIFPAFPRPFR